MKDLYCTNCGRYTRHKKYTFQWIPSSILVIYFGILSIKESELIFIAIGIGFIALSIHWIIKGIKRKYKVNYECQICNQKYLR